MEREGLIRREQCPNDARGWYAAITHNGIQTFRAARETHLAGVRERFLTHFSREELRALAELWERVDPGAVAER
jgi:DNA-binding MarR family transcriptional regulator